LEPSALHRYNFLDVNYIDIYLAPSTLQIYLFGAHYFFYILS